MSTILVVIVAAGLLWFLGIWPFNRSYARLPTYDEMRQNKTQSQPQVQPQPPAGPPPEATPSP